MLVPAAIEDGFVAATNAVQGSTHPLRQRVSPAGSFSDPEYAQVGLTEAKAHEAHDVVTTVVQFDSTVRANIEGRTFGFCKLIADRQSYQILGCHVVGERAMEIAQSAAIAIAARMPVDELARVAVSFPTYTEVLVHAAIRAAVELKLPLSGQAEHLGVSQSRPREAPSCTTDGLVAAAELRAVMPNGTTGGTAGHHRSP